MLGVALRGLAGRKLRALLTGLAVIIGVAMITGTYVLTDTISKSFDRIFETSLAGTDAVVSAKKVVDYSPSGAPTVPASLLATIGKLPSVAAVGGSVSDDSGARIADKRGKLIDTKGAPAFAVGVDPTQPRFNPLRLTAGRFPSAASEVVIDARTAKDNGYAVGDRVRIAVRGPARTFTIAGLVTFGTQQSLGSATITGFDLATAQRLLGRSGRLDAISIAGKPGVSAQDLTAEVARALPDGAQVRTGAAEAKEQKSSVAEGLGFINKALLAFAGIALFVGAFVIFNTLSITVAQRTREFATLRTLGASRRQVMGSVLAESLAIGLVSSLLGIAAGLGIAKGLNALFVSFGIDLPSAGTVLATRTIVVSLVVGTLVTVVASLVPARRATRIAPISAVREGATLAPTRLGRRAPVIGAMSGLAAVALLGYAVFGTLDTAPRMALLGSGLVVLFVAVAVVLPRLVGPLARVLGSVSARAGGVSGRLGIDNTVRNPGRTASTASALMIGLALMTFVAVFGNGLRQSDRAALREQLHATHVVSAKGGTEQNLPAGTSEAVGALVGVEVASGVRSDSAKAAGQEVLVNGVDPATIGRVYNFRWADASAATLAGLGGDRAIVTKDFATAHRLEVGSTFPITTSSGAQRTLRVAGTYRPSKFDPLLAPVIISRTAFDGAFARPSDVMTLVRLRDPGTGLAGLTSGVSAFPDATAQTASQFVERRASAVDQLLNLFYVLLALSIVVSLFGMVNTLALSVIERTREIGMMRAVGMSRRQASRMITHEGIVTALIGAAIGLPLGIGLAALITRALSSYDVAFRVPVTALLVLGALSVAAGIVAAVAPGRRAARLDVLRALQYE